MTRTALLASLRRSRFLAGVMAETGTLLRWTSPGPEFYRARERRRGAQIRALAGRGSEFAEGNERPAAPLPIGHAVEADLERLPAEDAVDPEDVVDVPERAEDDADAAHGNLDPERAEGHPSFSTVGATSPGDGENSSRAPVPGGE